MKKQMTSHNYYQPMASNGRFPTPVYSKQKTTWMRFLLFCLYGRKATVALQPVRVTHNRRFHPNR
jgi:hypothetical protein